MTNWPLNYDPVFGCELWASKLDRDGYGMSFRGKIITRAHVAVYREKVGPFDVNEKGEPLVLDHLCRRRACCAVHHLELVTQSENEKRKSWRYRARRTHCPRGHELNVHGVVTPEGGRICRQCNREARGPQ